MDDVLKVLNTARLTCEAIIARMDEREKVLLKMVSQLKKLNWLLEQKASDLEKQNKILKSLLEMTGLDSRGTGT